VVEKIKKIIEVEVYDQNVQASYKGRLLGLLSQKEYAGIIAKKDLRNKLFTVPTKPCSEIANLVMIEGLRLAIAVKEKDDKEVTRKTLFFTEQLDIISHVVSDIDITFVGKNGSYIILTEEEVNENHP